MSSSNIWSSSSPSCSSPASSSTSDPSSTASCPPRSSTSLSFTETRSLLSFSYKVRSQYRGRMVSFESTTSGKPLRSDLILFTLGMNGGGVKVILDRTRTLAKTVGMLEELGRKGWQSSSSFFMLIMTIMMIIIILKYRH